MTAISPEDLQALKISIASLVLASQVLFEAAEVLAQSAAQTRVKLTKEKLLLLEICADIQGETVSPYLGQEGEVVNIPLHYLADSLGGVLQFLAEEVDAPTQNN